MSIPDIIINYCTPLFGVIVIIYGIVGIFKKEIVVAGTKRTGKEAILPGFLAILFGILIIVFTALAKIYSN